ncbi:MAG: M3 family oligoendopeptidase, partial [Phycisphaerales bacterium]
MATARPYAPIDLDAADFKALEPHYNELLARPIASADDLEQLILDRSDLDALVAERAANLYIATTRNTEDKAAEGAYLGFVRDVEPKLKPVASALDRRIATSPFAESLPKARYEVLLRNLRVDIELFREENIPLETQLAELEQKYNQVVGRMTVEFDGQTRTMPQMARYLEETSRAVR